MTLTTQELIEQTLLHALGLLDEPERIAHEAALEAATTEVRARVMAEARRMADLGDLLPDDQPGEDLRGLVLAAVRAAMREQEAERRIAHTANGRERRHAQPALARSARVHGAWRAAAIALSVATGVLFIVSINNQGVYDQVSPEIRLSQIYDRIGAEFVDSTLFDPNTTRVALTPNPDADARTAVAALWHNPDWGSARLFVKNLPPAPDAHPYRLVVLDAKGNIVREVAEFNPTGELQDFEVSLNPSTESRLAIYQGIKDAIDQQPLLRSIGSGL